MFTARLKNGETVQVLLEDLEDFIENNIDQIQVQHKKMGKRRSAPVDSTSSASSKWQLLPLSVPIYNLLHLAAPQF